MESFEIILEKYDKEMSREEKVSWTEKKNEIYKELLKNMSPADLSEEVKSTLDALREKGLLLAIGSSSKMQDLSWDSWDLANILMPFLTETTSPKSKPDPEVFVKAAQFIGKEPEVCLVVEDAKAGVEAAKAGGMDCAAIGDAVKCGMAEHNLSTFADLLQVVQES